MNAARQRGGSRWNARRTLLRRLLFLLNRSIGTGHTGRRAEPHVISGAQWQWILLGAGPGDGGSSHRVARRRAHGGSDFVSNSGTASPMMDSWVSSPSAPSTISYGGEEYVRAFWSVTAHDTTSSQSSAQIQTGPAANDSHSGAGSSWTVTAKLYYVPIGGGPGVGPNDGYLLIDAYDVQAGDFFGDDFVDASPDPSLTLTPAANDGYIDTTTQVEQGAALTVAARDVLSNRQFAYWWPIDSLLVSADESNPATVGAPDQHDIVVHHNDRVFAYAFYNEVKTEWKLPPNYWLYNPWWWIETHGGLVPPGPTDPFRIQIEAASRILEATQSLSTDVRARGIELAMHQLSLTNKALQQALDSMRKERL